MGDSYRGTNLNGQLLTFSTGQISDALRSLGRDPRGLWGIRPASPTHARFAGPAVTVTFDHERGQSQHHDFFGHVTPGSVVLVTSSIETEWSLWGGKRSAQAIKHGAVATVVDGWYRDVEEHRQLAYPVHGRGSVVCGSGGLLVATSVNVPVQIGSSEVCPGDFLVGDESGVIRVPRGDVQRTLEAAAQIEASEREFFTDLGFRMGTGKTDIVSD